MKYELIIKEIESGEVVCRKECDCAVGAVAYEKDGELNADTISRVYGKVITSFGALAAARNTIEKFEKFLYEDFKKTLGIDLPIKEFEDFTEAFQSKFTAEEEIDGVTISVDEEAIKAIKERASDV